MSSPRSLGPDERGPEEQPDDPGYEEQPDDPGPEEPEFVGTIREPMHLDDPTLNEREVAAEIAIMREWATIQTGLRKDRRLDALLLIASLWLVACMVAVFTRRLGPMDGLAYSSCGFAALAGVGGYKLGERSGTSAGV